MDSNQSSIDFYKKIASNINDAKDVKLMPKNDNTIYDIDLIKKYASSRLLDLGSGTGLIINHLVNTFDSIMAVEFFEEFSKYIVNDKKITLVHENLLTFKEVKQFDVATMFGVAHHFNTEESFQIYQNIYEMLDGQGIFILKNQFGLGDTKTVTHSEELGSKYFAQYRELNFEIERLKSIGFSSIEVIDIYPAEANRWEDTHFYALVCHK